MKKKNSPPASPNLPVSKQTAGGVAGAIVGGVVAGPVGAVAGAIAGTIMGNRAAQGKPLVSSGTKQTAKATAKAVQAKLPSLKKGKQPKAATKTSRTTTKPRKVTQARAKAPVRKKAKATPAKRRKK